MGYSTKVGLISAFQRSLDAVRVLTAGFFLLFLMSPEASHADWVAGVATDVDSQGAGGVIEFHGPEFGVFNGVVGRLGFAGRLDADGDGWMGLGVSGLYPLRGNLFLEASFMPGAYKVGDTNLGGALHFRSLLGVGYQLKENLAVSVSIDHMSNGSTQSENPGSDAITLRFRWR